MEPSFNDALEAQAIGRVYRMGQSRPVTIVRLIAKGTIEARMVDGRTTTGQAKGQAQAPVQGHKGHKVRAQAGAITREYSPAAYNFEQLFS